MHRPAHMLGPRALAPAVLGVALALAACGTMAPADDPRAGQVVRVIQSFAAAEGEGACGLLTPAALERLYRGLEGCLKRSPEFEAGEVKVDEVTIGEHGRRAVAQARSLSGRTRFTVVLELVAAPGCREPCATAQWRIAEIRAR
jgi:hypothetical protein